MKSLGRVLILIAAALILIACGGGGGGGGGTTGGGTVTYSGRVLDVVTSSAVSPRPTITIAGQSFTVNNSDGSFSVDAPARATSALVRATGAGYPDFTFTFPSAITGADLGDLYVGPQTITVRGRVVDAGTGAAVPNANVVFAGRTATTNASGQFFLGNVAFSSANINGFWGIEGAVRADTYFASSFNANGFEPSGSEINVGEVTLVPLGGTTPPPIPYNLFGRVTPASQGNGARVELLQGTTIVRTTTASTDGRYFFWVPPGTYTLRAFQGTIQSGSVSVTITQANQIRQQDVVFP